MFTGTIDLSEDSALVTYIKETTLCLGKYNNRITLIAPYEVPKELRDLVECVSYKKLCKKKFKYISALIRSSDKINSNKCDILHCFGNEAASIALINKIFWKKKCIILSHIFGLSSAESDIHAKYSYKSKLLQSFNSWREKFIIKKSNGLIVLSQTAKNHLSKKYNIEANNIFVAPIGINIDTFDKVLNKDLELSAKFNLSGKDVILYTGWISALHGILELVKAMEIINESNNNAILLIVGNGPLRSVVEKYIQKNKVSNVLLLGQVPFNEIQRYHSIADILVIPHVKSAQTDLNPSTKVLEYLSSGKPIVASNLKPIADIVGKNAILVEPGDSQSIADGIIQLLNDKELRSRLGKGGKEIIKNYSWQNIGDKINEAYESMFDQR